VKEDERQRSEMSAMKKKNFYRWKPLPSKVAESTDLYVVCEA
jgi:hypothetical protein